MSVSDAIQQSLQQSRAASKFLRSATAASKDRVLRRIVDLLKRDEALLLKANEEDLASFPPDESEAFRDRLTLNASRVEQMRESLRHVAAIDDPVGESVERRTLSNGLDVKRVRSPLGVIFMIFESRPNVAIEAFSLGFKAGNTMILRGGKESRKSTAVIYSILSEALNQEGFPRACVWGITDPDRAIVERLLSEKNWIDVVVPRGGDKLIDYVSKTSRIPVIKNDRGLCHVYVHEDCVSEKLLRMAEDIVVNAKSQRPGVCNSMETLLVHDKVAPLLIPRLKAKLDALSVSWRACPRSLALLGKTSKLVSAAANQDWDTEHLALILNCRVVGSLDEAIAHIEAHGSKHSEAIVTSLVEDARRFENEVDAAAVYWNASTRFTDGFELGLGGELGISTQKLHVRGPVGLRELTSVRWIIEGEGQIRK
jgi:glutamate-5-semialdehyde dehydrogenase